MNTPIYCTCCERKLREDKVVYLELDTSRNVYTSAPVAESDSQGSFAFGPGCAKKADDAKTHRSAS